MLSLVKLQLLSNPARANCGFDLHSLMIIDIAHLFIYLLVIYMSSLEKHLFRFSASFLIRLFKFLSYLNSVKCLHLLTCDFYHLLC